MTDSGLAVLKAATRGHASRFAFLSRDLNIGLATLSDWAFGDAVISDKAIQVLARTLFGDVEYLATEDRLKRRPTPSSPMGAHPPSVAERVADGTFTLPPERPKGVVYPPPLYGPEYRNGPLTETHRPPPPVPPGWTKAVD
jgi:hypothetical protein